MTVPARAQRWMAIDRALGYLLAVAAAEFAVLVGTGAFLVLFYRPAANRRWSNLASVSSGDHLIEVMRLVHRALAGAMTVTLVVVALLGVATVARVRARAASAIGLGVAGVLAVISGYLLPWNQLALFAVKVNSDIRGFRLFIWHPSVVTRAYVRGAEVSIVTLRMWLFVHVVAIPLAVVGLGVVAARRVFRHRDLSGGHTGLGS